MLKLLVVLAAAGVLAGAAFAEIAPPAGFTLSTALSRPASFVAGKPVKVYCADTQMHFNAADKQYTGAALGAGFSFVGGVQTFLSVWVCSYLNRWNAKKPVALRNLAPAIEVLAHEAELDSGVTDESVADCKALAVTPALLAKFFPLRGAYTVHAFMRAAWDAHNREPAAYLKNCPPR